MVAMMQMVTWQKKDNSDFRQGECQAVKLETQEFIGAYSSRFFVEIFGCVLIFS